MQDYNDWANMKYVIDFVFGPGLMKSAFTGGEWVTCDFEDLAADVPLALTLGITTSEHFTSLLRADFGLTGVDEGNWANNQTWPVWVGSRPFEKVYLPLVVRQAP